jgi:hypothetical protein
MIRLYLVPREEVEADGATWRHPKYFYSEYSISVLPELENTPWSCREYGHEGMCLVVSDVTQEQHDALKVQPDVIAIPADLDSNFSSQAVSVASDFLESYHLPANWLNTSYTYREGLRVVSHFMAFMQRVHGMTKQKISQLGITMNTQWKDLPQAARDKLRDAALSYPLDVSGVTANTTVRQMLKLMVDQFEDRQYRIGKNFTL